MALGQGLALLVWAGSCLEVVCRSSDYLNHQPWYGCWIGMTVVEALEMRVREQVRVQASLVWAQVQALRASPNEEVQA